MTAGLLRTIIGIEAAAFALAFAVIIGHAFWLSRTDRSLEARMRIGRPLLLACLGGAMDDEIVQRLTRLGQRAQIRLFAELAPALQGEQRAILRALATQVGLTDHAERQCGSRLWWRRLYATRVLTLIDAGEETMPRLIHDKHQLVRTQVAEWATLHATPAILGAIAGLLDDPRRIARFAVQDTLLRIGQPAVAVLIGTLGQMSGLGIASGLLVAERIGDRELLPLGLSFVDHPEPVVRAAAARLLGAMGGDEAITVLRRLLVDPAADVRQAAVGGLGRLGHWESAVDLVPLLGDPTWPVRRESAVALTAMGAPGSLILRLAVRGPDRFAADMAAQALRAEVPRA